MNEYYLFNTLENFNVWLNINNKNNKILPSIKRFCCCSSDECNNVVTDAVNITAFYIQQHQLYLNQVTAGI